MSWSNVLTVTWFVIVGALAIIVGLSYLLNFQLKNLFKHYGSTVLSDVVDLVSVNTPAASLRIQRYIFTKAYKNEAQPELRLVGRRTRALGIIALILIVLGFAITALIIWVSVS